MVMGSNPLRLRSGFDSVDGVTTIICFYLIVYISCFCVWYIFAIGFWLSLLNS